RSPEGPRSPARPAGFQPPPNLSSRMTKVGKARAFVNLADAHELTLRAVGADTGKGLAGAVLLTDRASPAAHPRSLPRPRPAGRADGEVQVAPRRLLAAGVPQPEAPVRQPQQ